ncbi:MAG: phosphoadenylyl-sulfate reductase [Pseudorhodobacter sp.]|nr:phosphoadenylyl-sulfate reductase [Pseudorhodobacter sp.]
MPLDPGYAPLAEKVATLNERYKYHAAVSVLEQAMGDPDVGRIALVSSFGAESVVLLHMVSIMDRTTPVLFVDTQMLFAETLTYQTDVAARLGLTNVQIIRARPEVLAYEDPDNTLYQFNPDACCALRKTEPLERAIAGYDAWITGRKRYQGSTRAALNFFEAEGEARIKVNPLAHWGRDDIADYIINNRLPRHPLVAKGYPSIGCGPCTSPVAPGEDPRAGRWRGHAKTECGIHFINGKAVRDGAIQESAA